MQSPDEGALAPSSGDTEAADGSVQIFDLSANGFEPGPDFVAAAFNQAFGTDYPPSNILAR